MGVHPRRQLPLPGQESVWDYPRPPRLETFDGEITVELGTDTFPATARVLEGAERDAVYARQVAAEPQFGEYQRKTERIIPVVELVRAS